jgi:hypothetical protein
MRIRLPQASVQARGEALPNPRIALTSELPSGGKKLLDIDGLAGAFFKHLI